MPTLTKRNDGNREARTNMSHEWELPDIIAPQLDARRTLMPVGSNVQPGPIGPKAFLIITTPSAPADLDAPDAVGRSAAICSTARHFARAQRMRCVRC